jgi:hypothetical protein
MNSSFIDCLISILDIRSEQPLSFWRPYFIVKEWSDLQTKRKISLPIHLILCVLILEVNKNIPLLSIRNGTIFTDFWCLVVDECRRRHPSGQSIRISISAIVSICSRRIDFHRSVHRPTRGIVDNIRKIH